MPDLPQIVQTTLEDLRIPYTVTWHPPVFTIGEIEALGLPNVERVAKNLFLRDDKKRFYYLVVLPGSKTADLKKLQAAIGSRKLSFASEEDLMAKLGLTKGSVTPLGILQDQTHQVQVVLDQALLDQETVGVHPNRNDATLWLTPDHLLQLIRSQGNPLTLADL